LDFEHHMTTNGWHPDCRECTAIQAYRRITGHSTYRTIGPNTPGTPKRPEA
jgi:hypothetical protein